MVLIGDVLFDDFIGDVARADAEVAARPQMSPPELLLQMRELVQQFVRTLPLEHLHEATDGDSRRHADEEMDMVFRDVSFHDRDFVRAADFAEQFSDPQPDFTAHHWLAILRDPDQVQVDAKDRMCAVPIIRHAPNLARGRKPAKAFA